MTRKPFTVVVGSRTVVGLFVVPYSATVESMLIACRECLEGCGYVYSNDPRVVIAFQYLHRIGEIELRVERNVDDDVSMFDCDVNGDFIQPWPDEFFEIDFHLRFSMDENGKRR
jgi:hypothetical protein